MRSFLNQFLEEIDSVLCYIDDVFMFRKSPVESKHHLQNVFERFRKCGM